MLKKFFISMLGTIAGLWVTILIAMVVMVSIVSSLVASGAADAKINKESILYINLSGQMAERNQPGSVWQMISESQLGGDALVDILNSIDLAANDNRIKGIYISGSVSESGAASREEIAEALDRFKLSGKWVYAYGDAYDQGVYMIASRADSVFLNPMGAVGVHGVASMVPFFTGLLDKLGVKMQIVRVGTYKSAVEPFFATEMSQASRLQTQQMCDSLWAFVKTNIAASRGVEPAAVQGWADSLMNFWPAERDHACGAVSGLRYRREVENLMRRRLELDGDDELPLVTPTDYMATQKAFSKDKDHIAVLFAVGDIVDTGEGGIVGDVMTPQIIKLADDDHVKGLVLRINSGGGSAFASEQIWEALEYLKSKGKPFYVSMGDVAASGGYYIACGADSIFADRTTVTGSIGVFGMIPDLSGLVTGKFGITFSTVQSNENAVVMTLVNPMTDAQRNALQSSVNEIYETFTRRVADGRGMDQDSVKAIAEGRVWIGGRALEIGLVDHIGGLKTAVDAIAGKLGLDSRSVVYYPEVKDELLAEILRSARESVTVGGVTVDSETLRMMRFVNYLRTASPVQARMPAVIFE